MDNDSNGSLERKLVQLTSAIQRLEQRLKRLEQELRRVKNDKS